MAGVTNPDTPHLTALLTGRRGGLRARLGSGQPGGDAGGDRSQVRVRTRGERLADPRVELILGQPARTRP